MSKNIEIVRHIFLDIIFAILKITLSMLKQKDYRHEMTDYVD